MMNMQYLNARWVLGWALVKHVCLRPFVRRDPRRWVARIAQDQLGATPREAWSYLASTSRCIGCGLCDVVVPQGVVPSAWILGTIRQPEDAPLALHRARLLRDHADAIEKVCPTRVDVRNVARLIEENARALGDDPLAPRA